MRNANGLLNDQGKQALGSAEQAMKSLEQSSATINGLLSKNQNSLDNGMQGLNGLAPAIRELRETLTSLRGISQRLEANPSGYLLGSDKNKEFTHEADSLRLPRQFYPALGVFDPAQGRTFGCLSPARRASARPASSAATQHWSLRLNKLQASEALNRPNIAVIPQGDVISSYKASRWSDPAPVLVRNRLLDGFARDGRVTLLSTDDSNFAADLELGGSLQAFQTEYQGNQASVVVRVDALLVRGYDQKILASRRFEERQPLSDVQVPAVVAGFGQASDRLTAKVVAWAVDQGQKVALQRP